MATKKKGAKKATAKSVASKATTMQKAVKDPMNKTGLYSAISDMTLVAKKDVGKVFDALSEVINAHIRKNAAGTFTLPGLFKVKTVRKPATKARKGINPFTGEETIFKAKPARTVVKVLPLKKVKDMAS